MGAVRVRTGFPGRVTGDGPRVDVDKWKPGVGSSLDVDWEVAGRKKGREVEWEKAVQTQDPAPSSTSW